MTVESIQRKIEEKNDYLSIVSKEHPSYQKTIDEITELKEKLIAITKTEN